MGLFMLPSAELSVGTAKTSPGALKGATGIADATGTGGIGVSTGTGGIGIIPKKVLRRLLLYEKIRARILVYPRVL